MVCSFNCNLTPFLAFFIVLMLMSPCYKVAIKFVNIQGSMPLPNPYAHIARKKLQYLDCEHAIQGSISPQIFLFQANGPLANTSFVKMQIHFC
jgi:hypothetical protein